MQWILENVPAAFSSLDVCRRWSYDTTDPTNEIMLSLTQIADAVGNLEGKKILQKYMTKCANSKSTVASKVERGRRERVIE